MSDGPEARTVVPADTTSQGGNDPMSAETNKQLIREFMDTVNRGDYDRAAGYLAPDAAVHFPGISGSLSREAFKGVGQMFYAAFPDGRHEIEDVVGDEACVLLRFSFTGTQTGELQGI